MEAERVEDLVICVVGRVLTVSHGGAIEEVKCVI